MNGNTIQLSDIPRTVIPPSSPISNEWHVILVEEYLPSRSSIFPKMVLPFSSPSSNEWYAIPQRSAYHLGPLFT